MPSEVVRLDWRKAGCELRHLAAILTNAIIDDAFIPLKVNLSNQIWHCDHSEESTAPQMSACSYDLAHSNIVGRFPNKLGKRSTVVARLMSSFQVCYQAGRRNVQQDSRQDES
jgi:hypothetical protein